MRTLHLSELETAGAARAQALREADEQLDRIARLLPDALVAGISIAEIARLAHVSRPTVYELRGRYSDAPRDLRFAALAAVARLQPVSVGDLAEALLRSTDELHGALDQLEADTLIDWDIAEGPDGHDKVWNLTLDGFEALEAWDFHIAPASVEDPS